MSDTTRKPNAKKNRAQRRARPSRAPQVSGNANAQIRVVAEMVFDIDSRMERGEASRIANGDKSTDPCPGAPPAPGKDTPMSYAQFRASLRETKEKLKQTYGTIWADVESVAERLG